MCPVAKDTLSGVKKASSHQQWQPPNPPSKFIMFPYDPVVQERSLLLIHDMPQDLENFRSQLENAIQRYLATSQCYLPALKLAFGALALTELEQIVQEEKPTKELFLECCLIEIHELCLTDLVVAAGARAQELVRDLQEYAATVYPDGGTQFLTMADALREAGKPEQTDVAVDDQAARDTYLQAIAKKIYQF